MNQENKEELSTFLNETDSTNASGLLPQQLLNMEVDYSSQFPFDLNNELSESQNDTNYVRFSAIQNYFYNDVIASYPFENNFNYTFLINFDDHSITYVTKLFINEYLSYDVVYTIIPSIANNFSCLDYDLHLNQEEYNRVNNNASLMILFIIRIYIC